MHTRSLTHALVGAAAVVALAGCSPSATSLEPEPGEIDWDIAVTRASIQFGRPGGVEYNWWGHEAAVVRGDDAAPAVEDIITSGLDKMCAAVPSEDQAGPRGGFLVDVIALEAVAGAVVTSSSEEFRENYATWWDPLPGRSSEQKAARDEAIARLEGDLLGEWRELYDLQIALEQEAFTLEGAQSAHEAVAERCDVELAESAVAVPEPEHVKPYRALSEPPD